MGRSYSDLVGGETLIKASHISTLRSYIDDDASQVPPVFRYNFSWTSVTPGQPILAKYLTEMRSAIQLLWDSKGRGPLPDWSSGVTPGGPSNNRTPSIIRASDITDLRRWLNDYEDNHSKSGVNSYSYSPNSPNSPVIALSWSQNVAALSSAFPPPIRCNIVASSSNLSSNTPLAEDIDGYGTAIQRYQGAELSSIYALMGFEFFNRDGDSNSPNFPFDGGNFYNSYIENFAEKVGKMAKKLSDNNGIKNFVLWNEPNDTNKPDKFLGPGHFASLLYHSNSSIKSTVSDANIIWGGIIFGPGGPNNQPDEDSLTFIRDVYTSLSDRNLAGFDGAPWSWSAINIHIHQVHWEPVGPNRTSDSIENIFVEIRKIMQNQGKGDDSAIIVGEYGVTIEEEEDYSGSLNNLFNWIKRCDPNGMFYFSHGRAIDNGTWALVLETYTSDGSQILIDSEYITYSYFKTLLETLP